MSSIFMNKEEVPTDKDLKKALGTTYALWQAVAKFTKGAYPAATEEWSHSGAKYGWSFRIKDKKRVLVYLLPRDKFFMVSMVFGQKATDTLLKSNISEAIKTELKNAKVYAEGRGIKIDVRDKTTMKDIEQLIEIKIVN